MAQDPPARLVVLVSGTGTLLQALLDAAAVPSYGARVVAVVADRPDPPALERARAAGVAAEVVSYRDHGERSAWDASLAAVVGSHRPDLVVCAGFMRILGPAFLERFGSRTLNTHPALLPSFPGTHAVRDALSHGVHVTGCTVHLVDAGVDTGPIVAQAAVPVLAGDDEATLHERIKTVERTLLVETVRRMVTDGYDVDGRKVHLR